MKNKRDAVKAQIKELRSYAENANFNRDAASVLRCAAKHNAKAERLLEHVMEADVYEEYTVPFSNIEYIKNSIRMISPERPLPTREEAVACMCMLRGLE